MGFVISIIGFFKLIIRNFILLIFFIFSPNSFALETFEIYEKLNNSTVRINIWENYGTENAEVVFGGSGIVFNKYRDTYFILTNAHVVLSQYCLIDSDDDFCVDRVWDGSKSIMVDTTDSSYEYLVADEDFVFWDDLDLAVIALDGSEYGKIDNFEMLEIGGPFLPLVQVYSAGFPYVVGNLKNYRDLFFDACVINAGIFDEEGLLALDNYSIVHDCTISGGMSGGPLVTEDGKLLAVNGLIGQPILEQGYLGAITSADYDNLNYAFAIHIYDLYLRVLLTDSGNFNPQSKFYNFLPRLALEEHQELYDFLLNDSGGDRRRLDRMFK
tara:strand:+ start:302 stop:1282 length:981 start_codon:yes stop_codon:yes gene_type:complete